MDYRKKYIKFFNYGDQIPIISELGGYGCEIHHISRRSREFGEREHSISNLIALTAHQHQRLHNHSDFPLSEEYIQDVHDNFVINFLLLNPKKVKALDIFSYNYYTNLLQNGLESS